MHIPIVAEFYKSFHLPALIAEIQKKQQFYPVVF